jgi:glycosyltransferase involved in cell wall biosynthesis
MAELVVASAYGATGASTRVRVLDWLRYLGLEADVESYLGTANVRPSTLARRPLDVTRAEVRLRRLRRRPDIQRLLISRSMGPFTRGGVEEFLLRRAVWGVYDFDDALFADSSSGVYRLFGQHTAWARAVSSADQVIAGNDYLAEAAAALNPNVVVIPSCVEPDDYPVKRHFAIGTVPRLVWMGSPATEHYVHAIAPALLQVNRITGARLTMVSAGTRSLGSLAAMTDRVPWRGPATHAQLTAADCGIMPLPDTPYARGKCAYKLLQYAAAGLPAVASPVGINARVIEKVQGVAAGDVAAWVEALLAVLREPEAVRSARGSAARRAVEDHYSFAAWREPFLRALRLSGRPADQAAERTRSPSR